MVRFDDYVSQTTVTPFHCFFVWIFVVRNYARALDGILTGRFPNMRIGYSMIFLLFCTPIIQK